MSAEIPGSIPDFRQATDMATELVTKIMLAAGERPDVAHIYGQMIGGYAGEIILTALNNAELLNPEFSPQKLNDAVSAIDGQMNLEGRLAGVEAREDLLSYDPDMVTLFSVNNSKIKIAAVTRRNFLIFSQREGIKNSGNKVISGIAKVFDENERFYFDETNQAILRPYILLGEGGRIVGIRANRIDRLLTILSSGSLHLGGVGQTSIDFLEGYCRKLLKRPLQNSVA